VVSYERPRSTGEPYYPVPIPAAQALYGEYLRLATSEAVPGRPKVYFSGRLATYRYLNTDEAIENALETFAKIKQDRAAHPGP
jgi:UDP-galactopyranose mutase